jgi:predicted CopG family antitoxin
MADKKDNLTIYQKLFTVFGQGGGTMRSDTNLNPKYSLGDKDLIVSKSREDFEKTKLQLQQQKYLDSQWQKIENDMYQKATYYETTRLASYMDYEAMEFTPEIAVALETMAEESCTLNEQGQIMSIYSDSSRIKKVLEDLFFNVLDIHSNLPMWTRNTCKYGDNFVHLKLNYKYGVIGATQLTNIEISRSDSNNFDYNETNSTTNEDSKKEVKFEWKSKNISFNAWEVAHFRLLGDDRKLPYGTSVLDKVRRTWRQLLLAEDAMLVYRVTRAPERRVFKVYVGNIDDEDVESYVQKVANKFKRTQTADNNSGQVDVRYNTLAVDQDYFVPVRDPNSPSPIETLPGATNLDQIADIQFIQRKMVTALRVPKTFLGFEEPTGEGKNLALMDIRFARTINRIQQAMIQELNKIAIVHLYMLGFHEELSNFKLSLNNPSTQGEMLKVEQWKEKVLLYKDLVAASDGIAPTSHTWAKKNIFNWSEDEIKLDLEQQRLEKAAAAELEKTPEVITKTGYFDKVDKLYGDIMTQKMNDTESEETGEFGGEETGGGFGGDTGGFGGDTGGFGGEETSGGFGGDDTGGDFGEGFRGDEDVIDKLLLEGKKKNEDIIMMTSGIDELLNEENFDEKDILT